MGSLGPDDASREAVEYRLNACCIQLEDDARERLAHRSAVEWRNAGRP